MYNVIVSNIGVVYEGRSRKLANETFELYKDLSTDGYGRAGGEDVTLFIAGEIEKNHWGMR